MTTDYTELLAPLIERKKSLFDVRQQMQDAVNAATSELQQIDRVLRAAGLIETTPKNKKREQPGIRKVADLEAYLREHHANGGGFKAPDLMGKGFSNHLIYNGLKVLADRGAIRLDRKDGMAKIYKLVVS